MKPSSQGMKFEYHDIPAELVESATRNEAREDERGVERHLEDLMKYLEEGTPKSSGTRTHHRH